MKRPLFMTVLLALLTGGTSSALPPRGDEMQRVVAISRDLEQATRDVYQQADEQSKHVDAREDAAVRRLYELQSRAHYFRRTVDAYSTDPARTEDEFQNLVAAYTAASASMNDLHRGSQLAVKFDRVERLMNDLSDRYGGQERFWGLQRGRSDVRRMTVPAGTDLTVRTRTGIRSRDMRAGDRIDVVLANDLVVDGRTVASHGDPAIARVKDVDHAGKVEGREHLVLELTEVTLGDRLYPVETSDVTFVAEGSKKRDAGVIGGGAIVGAIIGAITGEGDGAAKGAAIGAAAGTGVVLTTKGKSVRLEPGTPITFTLQEHVRIRGTESPRNDRERRDRPGGISRR